MLGNLSVAAGAMHIPYITSLTAATEDVTGNYTLASGGTLSLDLAGITAGSLYDQVVQSGSGTYSTTLGGALNLNWTGFAARRIPTELWIVRNDTTGTLSGAFRTMPTTVPREPTSEPTTSANGIFSTMPTTPAAT